MRVGREYYKYSIKESITYNISTFGIMCISGEWSITTQSPACPLFHGDKGSDMVSKCTQNT